MWQKLCHLWTKLRLPISINIQHCEFGYASKQYKLMHNNYLTHISIFKGLFEIARYLYCSTDNGVLTWDICEPHCIISFCYIMTISKTKSLVFWPHFINAISQTCIITYLNIASHTDFIVCFLECCKSISHLTRIVYESPASINASNMASIISSEKLFACCHGNYHSAIWWALFLYNLVKDHISFVRIHFQNLQIKNRHDGSENQHTQN